MICKVCNKEIAKGQRYKTETLKSLHFCSNDCYSSYVKSPPRSDMRVLTDYIEEYWPCEIDWRYFATQIKSYEKDYGLKANDVRLVLKYCFEYLELVPSAEYGLGQFIPKYIAEVDKFKEQIRQNKAHECEEDVVVYGVPSKTPQKPLLNKSILEF